MKLLSALILLVLVIKEKVVQGEETISINIDVGSSKINTKINTWGEDNKLVTDEEINAFNITKENLNSGIRVEIGRRADNLFLRDPTPYENLFQKFKWKQTFRNLKIVSTDVEVSSEKFIFRTVRYVNNSTFSRRVNIRFVDEVEVTALSHWSEKGLPDDEIFYDVNINFNTVSFQYKNKWRSTSYKSKDLPFGYSKDTFIKLGSGQTAKQTITAYKTYLMIKIVYLAKIDGDVIADYNNLYGKYHFWAPKISRIMKAGNIENKIYTTEFLEIRGYTDARANIVDEVTGANIPIEKPYLFQGSRIKP